MDCLFLIGTTTAAPVVKQILSMNEKMKGVMVVEINEEQ